MWPSQWAFRASARHPPLHAAHQASFLLQSSPPRFWDGEGSRGDFVRDAEEKIIKGRAKKKKMNKRVRFKKLLRGEPDARQSGVWEVKGWVQASPEGLVQSFGCFIYGPENPFLRLKVQWNWLNILI